MLNIDSTRNHLKIIEVCFNMLRECAHTYGTLGKTSYDFVAYGTGIRSRVDRLFTLMNNGWAYPCEIICD